MKHNKKFLLIALPLAVVIPLLVITWIVGPSSIWLWAGIGIGMAIHQIMQRRQQQVQKEVQTDETAIS